MNLSQYYADRVYPVTPSTRAKKEEYVYLLKNELTGFHKVGITIDIDRRVSALECQNGCSLTIVAYVLLEKWCDESAKLSEKAIHEYFKEKRLKGEWFILEYNDVISIVDMFLSIEGLDTFYAYDDDFETTKIIYGHGER